MGRSWWRGSVWALGVVAAVLSQIPRIEGSPYWQAPFYELGVQHGTGGLVLGDGTALSGSGIRLFEHAGFITPATLGLPIAVFYALTIKDRKVTGVRRTYEGQDGFHGRIECEGSTESTRSCREVTYRSKRVLTSIEVDSVPLPPEEVAAQRAQAAGAVGGLMGLTAHFDLTYYPNRDDGSLHGAKVTWYLLTARASVFEIATGYHYERLRAEAREDHGASARVKRYRRRAHAIPVMVTIRPVPWLYGSVELEGNLLGLKAAATVPAGTLDEAEDRSSVVRAVVTLGLPRKVPWLHRLYMRGGVERSRLSTSDRSWGTFLEGGLRF